MIRRGELWWANLPRPHGSGPGFRRPVVVAQADPFNESSIRTVVVAAVTGNIRLADAPGNFVLRARKGRLPKRCVVNVSQLLTMDKALLDARVGRLNPEEIKAFDAGLRTALAL